MRRALIFDFDGLILDTETPEFEVWREIFAARGQDLSLAWWAEQMGRGVDQAVESPDALLARLTGGPVDRTCLHADARNDILARIDAAPLMPGIVDLLADCARSGVATAIATSSRHAWVDPRLAQHGLAPRFQAVCTLDEAGVSKPDPAVYRCALESLGVAPDEAIALEDSPNGIRAAQAAGIFTVAVANPLTALLDLGHADARLDSLAGVSWADLQALAAAKRP